VKVAISSEQHAALEALESRVRAILPEKYEDCYEEVQPVSMGSAGLKYGRDGRVAWNEMWGSFCDLAMAGGPPHKGTLLESATQADIDAQPDRYRSVVEEICRGIEMVSGFYAEASPIPGWIRVHCVNRSTADWLLRAITMENVSVRSDGLALNLPAGPFYRIEKEIKNVITVTAKTSHYWFGHMSPPKRRNICKLLETIERESLLLQPAASADAFQPDSYEAARKKMSETIHKSTGLRSSSHQYFGWLGLEYPDVHSAIWIMRAPVASNILSRREGPVLFVPVDPLRDPGGEKAARTVVRLHAFATARGVL
jgi:sirohydrochlorin cobaltochelatase